MNLVLWDFFKVKQCFGLIRKNNDVLSVQMDSRQVYYAKQCSEIFLMLLQRI